MHFFLRLINSLYSIFAYAIIYFILVPVLFSLQTFSSLLQNWLYAHTQLSLSRIKYWRKKNNKNYIDVLSFCVFLKTWKKKNENENERRQKRNMRIETKLTIKIDLYSWFGCFHGDPAYATVVHSTHTTTGIKAKKYWSKPKKNLSICKIRFWPCVRKSG